MKKKTETFASLIGQFQYHFALRTVFDDFLTMTLTILCLDPKTGLSHDEDLYMETIKKYATHDLRHVFPKMFAALINEMEERNGSSEGNDVLGDFYEQNLANKGMGQVFTPWPVCVFMAGITCGERQENKERLRIIDPCCGSGRMLLAGSRVLGPFHDYYAIDLDYTCVKMAAINLFLNGVFHGEVMCADALRPDHFIVSYKLSMFPFGAFRITEKEKSPLWHLNRASFTKQEAPVTANPEKGNDAGVGSQLSFF